MSSEAGAQVAFSLALAGTRTNMSGVAFSMASATLARLPESSGFIFRRVVTEMPLSFSAWSS